MKYLKTLFILGLITILVSACGDGKTGQSLEIGCDQFNPEAFITDSITINNGEEITVKLCSNPSTGFQWSETPDNSHPEILAQNSHEYQTEGDQGTPLPPGTPGVEVWTFTAQDVGQSTLYFEYSRDWEGGEKGIWTFTLDITVQ